METLHKRQLIILSSLVKAQEALTAKELSVHANVSVRTIKSEIARLNTILPDFGVSIQSKAGEGYWLVFGTTSNEADFNSWIESHEENKQDNIPKYNYERINYIIKKLLVVDYHIKLEDLIDEIYVSRSTLTQDLKKVRSLLHKFRLTIVSRPNYGILIEGNEIDKRLCIAEYFFRYNERANYSIDKENMFNTGKNRYEYDQIILFITEVCRKYNIMISDFSLNNLAIHISIALRRCTFYNYIKAGEMQFPILQESSEMKAAFELTQKLEEAYHFLLPLGETMYYALHLQSKRIATENDLSEDANVHDCIMAIFAEVKSNFEVDFQEDKVLYDNLRLHIPQMATRLRNHMIIRNPLVYDNMRRYLFATKITHSASAIIKDFYDVDVDENEFGYLILYFNLAIAKYQNRKKIRIGIVSGRGRPETIMYFNEMQEHFSQERYSMSLIENTLLENRKVEDFDYLITTYTLQSTIDIPVYVIKDDNYINEIRQELNHLPFKTLDFSKYFKEKFSYFDIEGDTKEEVLHNFYLFMKQNGIVEVDIREDNAFRTNEIGNGIVHFQDLYRICRKGFCFIGVLKKPVLWDLDVVRVLIMIKTKRDGDKDLPVLCSMFSKWANDASKVEALVQTMSFQAFVRDIKDY